MVAYFVSFYPRIPLDENLSIFEPLHDHNIHQLLSRSAGVLLPPYVPPWRYRDITRLARHWFPRLETRFAYQGKSKQIELFRRLGVNCPETLLFRDPSQLMERLHREGIPWSYPLVLKGDQGAGGSTVFPVYSSADIARRLKKLPRREPVLLQKWVRHGGRDLRVVIYGCRAVSYFRLGNGGFYNNVCRGGRIDHELYPAQQQTGVQAVLQFCRRAIIDIAGFDLMFPDEGEPVFIEINFHFGRKGLGGPSGHQKKLRQAVTEWRTGVLGNA